MRVLLSVSYVGTPFCGWQRQKNCQNTVQQVLEEALERVLNHKVTVFASGRTDVGVHAYGQTAHFDTLSEMPLYKLVSGANFYLPQEICVYDAKIVADDFHARYNAVSKTYVYKFYYGTQSPFEFNRRLFLHKKPCVDAMKAVCNALVGTKDFSAFMGAGSSVRSTVRTVNFATITQSGSQIDFVVNADGFLYNMVRVMAMLLIKAAEGKVEPECVEDIILSKNRALIKGLAPAYALYLKEVFY